MDTKTLFSSPANRVIAGIALASLAAAFLTYAAYTVEQIKQIDDGYNGPMTIIASGEGEVTGKPDVATFSFSILATGLDSVAAQNDVNTKMKAIVDYLKEQGVEEKDIKNDYYNMYPKYRYEEVECMDMYGYCPSNEIQDGFEITQGITVKVRDTAKAGEVLSGVGGKGATNLSGLSFTIDDTKALEIEARSLAIAEAKVEAERLAKELGKRIDKMVTFQEDGGYDPYYYGGYESDAMYKASVESAILPTGENTITANVHITYQLK